MTEASSLSAQAANARAIRSGWLDALGSGVVSIADLLAAARGPGGRPLVKLALGEVLYASMRHRYPASAAYARRASRAVLSEVLSRSGVPGRANVKVSWLLSSRSKGHRLDALAEVLARDGRQAPSERWPY